MRCPKCDGKGYIKDEREIGFCHVECVGKDWVLMESNGGSRVPTPYVKHFTCLAEARKAMITYQKNTDFQHLTFSLKQLKTQQEKK